MFFLRDVMHGSHSNKGNTVLIPLPGCIAMKGENKRRAITRTGASAREGIEVGVGVGARVGARTGEGEGEKKEQVQEQA